ncbi:MAG: hypothetical protein DWH91_08885 [Planctomycetota bacterium]|nr:MAG: hypothetical protein DWH91_08885 [Planctomycetota bacterium]
MYLGKTITPPRAAVRLPGVPAGVGFWIDTDLPGTAIRNSAAGGIAGMVVLGLLFLVLIGSSGFAQLPATRLDGLFPAGGAPGATVEVTISGLDLDDVDRLQFSHEGIKATRKMADPTKFDDGPQPVENVFVITVDGNVPPANYEIRVQGKYGLSNPRTFVVGSLPEVIEREPNGGNDIPAWVEITDAAGQKTKQNPAVEVSLPSTVNGQAVNGPDVDWYRFAGTVGQRVLIDGYARRIDSRMDLVVTVVDAAGRVLGNSQPGPSGDPLVDVTLPASGEYFVKAHDALYQQGPGYYYRLKLGVLPHLDFVFPPAGLPGSNEEYTLYGRNLPGGQASPYQLGGRPIEMVKLRIPMPGDVIDRLSFTSRLDPHASSVDGIEHRVTSGNQVSNPVLITAASAPVVVEQANDAPATAQTLKLPCEVAGQFYPQRDVDWYQFEAKAGEKWAIDLVSQRLNIPSDPSLLVQRVAMDATGKPQVTDIVFLDDVSELNVNNKTHRHEFDNRSSDPVYLFTVPADGIYRIMVRDSSSSVRSDPRLVYRLAIRQPAPDYRLVAVPGESVASLMLRKGGREVVRVYADRRDGFTGDIRVTATGLPPGVTTEEITIGSGNIVGTFVLTATEAAPVGIGTLQVTSKSTINGQEVTRKARYGAALAPYQFAQPQSNIANVSARLVERIQVCVTDAELSPQMLTLGDGKLIETARGGIVKLPYQLKSQEGVGGNLIGFPIDYPPMANVPQVSIGAAAAGEFQLSLTAQTPPGTYTFYLAGFNQGLQYKRNPEAAVKAKARQERIGKILMEAQTTAQTTQTTAQTKQTELTAANAVFTQATTLKQTADQMLAPLTDAHKLAEAALAQKQELAKASPTDENLKAEVVKAQAALDDAAKKLKEAQTAAEEAAKKLDEATTLQKAAMDAKTLADTQLTMAQQFQQLAQQEKQRADQIATQRQNEANPRGFNVNVPSNSITIKIDEFPIKVDALQEAASIKQGDKIEIPVKITRLYGLTTAISIQTQPLGSLGGVSFSSVNIPDNQLDAKFEIAAAANATVGDHTATVRLVMNFNGQQLILERPLKLTVIEVKPTT